MSNEKRKVAIHVGDGWPIVTTKHDRNAPCSCGSGKKQKHCCGNKTAFYSSKKIKEARLEENEKREKEYYISDKPLNAAENP